jgi:hypothetical protein
MIYSRLPSKQSINQGTPRARASPASFAASFESDSTPSDARHRKLSVDAAPKKDALLDFEGMLRTSRAIELHFAQFPVDFGVESLFRVCCSDQRFIVEKRENGVIMKDELVALIHDIDAKAKVKKKPSQADIVEMFMKIIDQHSETMQGHQCNSLTFSQTCEMIQDMRRQDKLDALALSEEQLKAKFRDQVGIGSFNISHFKVQSFLAAFPGRPVEALDQLVNGKMFAPRSKRERVLTDLSLWSFLKQLAMPPHVFAAALALKLNSVDDLIAYVKDVAECKLAHLCYHFCISKCLAQRLALMCSDDLDERVCRNFCLLPRQYVYEEFIVFYTSCDECAAPDDEIEAAAYRFSDEACDERGVSILSLFEVQELLQMHRMWPGAAIKDVKAAAAAAAGSVCGSPQPPSFRNVIVRVGLEMYDTDPFNHCIFCNTLSRYEPIFEELDVQTVQDLQDLDIEFMKKAFPEFSLDFDACDRLEKLKAIDEDFILNSYASLDFQTCKNILELHCNDSRSRSRSSTKITSFFGSSNAATVFALFLSAGNFSQFQLSSFLSMHPGREAWVSRAEGREATFLFAVDHSAPSSSVVTHPNFFSPAPVCPVISSAFCFSRVTLSAQVSRRVHVSFMSVAKRLATLAPSSSEQEYKAKYSSVLDMYEKESVLLPCAQYSQKSVIQKRFSLLHRSHVYNHLMKVTHAPHAIYASVCFQTFDFADVSLPVRDQRTFCLRLVRPAFGLRSLIHVISCRAQSTVWPRHVARQPLRSHLVFGSV